MASGLKPMWEECNRLRNLLLGRPSDRTTPNKQADVHQLAKSLQRVIGQSAFPENEIGVPVFNGTLIFHNSGGLNPLMPMCISSRHHCAKYLDKEWRAKL